jgi:hypothetical protein
MKGVMAFITCIMFGRTLLPHCEDVAAELEDRKMPAQGRSVQLIGRTRSEHRTNVPVCSAASLAVLRRGPARTRLCAVFLARENRPTIAPQEGVRARPIPTASSVLLLGVSSKPYSTTGHHLGSVFFSITPAVDTLARHCKLLSIFCARRQRSKARAPRETSDCPVASGAIGIVTLKNRTTPWPPAGAGSTTGAPGPDRNLRPVRRL